MRRFLIVASACLALAFAGLAAGCGDDEDTSSTPASSTPSETTGDEADTANVAGAGHATVEISQVAGNAFDPETVTVAPADVIRFTNDDSIDHNVVAEGDQSFESPTMGPGGHYDVRVQVASGVTISYVCTFHSGMEGTIEVK